MNDTILKRRFFVDSIRKQLSCRPNDFDSALQICENFREFVPWLYLSLLDEFDRSLLTNLAALPNDPLNIFKRLVGDDVIVALLRGTTGNLLTSQDFQRHSIVNILKDVLAIVDFGTLVQLAENIYVVLRDEERDRDLNVLFGFKALFSILRGDTDELPGIARYITEPSIFVDMLSVLFVRNSSNRYVCTFETLETVLSTLMAVWKDDVIVAGVSKLEIWRCISAENSMENCFVSPIAVVAKLFSTGDYNKALTASVDVPLLHHQCRLAKAMNEMRTHQSMPYFDDPMYKNDVNVEMAATSGDFNYPFESELVVRLFERRKANPRISKLDELQAIAKNANDWFDGRATEFVSEGGDFLIGFQRYLELFKRLSKENVANSIDIIVTVIESDDIPNWDSLVGLLGPNTLEKLLLSIDARRVSPTFVSIVKEISEIIALILQMTANLSQEAVPYNSIIRKWKLSKTAQAAEARDYLLTRDLLFASLPVNIDILWDIRYQFSRECQNDMAFYQETLALADFI
jgi:hypothetical protein